MTPLIVNMSDAELSTFTEERRTRRKLRLRKAPARKTVKALATAWRVEEETLAKITKEVLGSKE